MSREVTVLGAGMVGVCCALALRRRGLDVTLIDRKEPGRETSFGNSGVLSRSSVFPINGPGLIAKLPTYLTNHHPAVRWRPSMVKNPRWLALFLAACNAPSAGRRAAALNDLIRISMDLNRQLIAQAGLSAHLRETGWLKVWRSPDGNTHAEAEARALAAFEIETRVLDGSGVKALEPDATSPFSAGLHIISSASVDDPAAIVAGYADLFRAEGGKFVRAEMRGLFQTTTGWRVHTTVDSLDADDLIVSLGPWSSDALRLLALNVPLGFERGYHVHLGMQAGRGPRRAVYDVDAGYVVSPMRAGARVTSGVEVAARDAPPDLVQIRAAAAKARETFALGAQVEATPWLGARPTLPDSVPMIGEIPHFRGLWAAFGHQHVGLSTGAGTGALLAALMTGETPPIDAAPFAPERYL